MRVTDSQNLSDLVREIVCSPGGYLDHQGYDISPVQALIPKLQRLLAAFRKAGFPIYYTREGKLNLLHFELERDGESWFISFLGHRPDLSTLSSREAFRSYNNASGLGIGSPGPLGRLLVRGEAGHDIVPELYPLQGEPVIDKPGRGAFAHTDFELLLRIKGIKNLIIAGVTTDVCVSSTMREANDRAFDCLLLHDGSAASEESLHRSTCSSVKMEGGIFGAIAAFADVLNFVGE